jgi:alcohol dehydrogenase class IV
MSSSHYYQYNMRSTIHCAAGSVIRIPALFEGMGAKRVVLFSDIGLEQAGIVDQIKAVFASCSSNKATLVGVYTGISQDAACQSVNAATAYARSVAADAILAVGGGSVLDASKGVKYSLQHGATDIAELLQSGIKIDAWPSSQHSGIPHIGVPTTAGTGAEVSPVAVFYNEALGIKTNLVAPFLEPDMAVLDGNLCLGLPDFLTAATGMDALTHAIEAVASPTANAMTDAHAFHAAQMIVENLPKVIDNGKDVVARSNMLQASSLAIDAFGGSLNAIPIHNCAHAFGGMFHIPHGDANAALLPVVMEACPEFYAGKGLRLAKALNLSQNGSDQELLGNCIKFLKDFQQRIGCTTNFKRWEVNQDKQDAIYHAIASDPAAMFYSISPAAMAKIVQAVC